MSSLWSSCLARDSTGRAVSWSSFSPSREGSSVWTSAITSSGRTCWLIHNISLDNIPWYHQGSESGRQGRKYQRNSVEENGWPNQKIPGKEMCWFKGNFILTSYTSGFEQSDIRNSQQILEDVVQWVWEHACGTCEVLPASHPPESGPVPVRAGGCWATVRNTSPWPHQHTSQGGQTTVIWPSDPPTTAGICNVSYNI